MVRGKSICTDGFRVSLNLRDCPIPKVHQLMICYRKRPKCDRPLNKNKTQPLRLMICYRKRKRDSAVETASIQTMSAGRRQRDKREFRSVEILDRALI